MNAGSIWFCLAQFANRWEVNSGSLSTRSFCGYPRQWYLLVLASWVASGYGWVTALQNAKKLNFLAFFSFPFFLRYYNKCKLLYLNKILGGQMDSEFLTAEEVTKYLRSSLSIVYKLGQDKQLPGVIVGKHWQFRRETFQEWIKEKEKSSFLPENNSIEDWQKRIPIRILLNSGKGRVLEKVFCWCVWRSRSPRRRPNRWH